MTTETLIDDGAETVDMRAFALEHSVLRSEEDLDPEVFPELTSFSPAFFFRLVAVPEQPDTHPEYVYVKRPEECGLTGEDLWRYRNFIYLWNNTWESGRARPGFVAADSDIPDELRWITEADADLRLVSRAAGHSYDPHSPLYHLLPLATLQRFGLPPLRRGIWPQHVEHHLLEHIVASDFDERLQQAVMYHLWPLLGARGAPSCFSESDPIRMLSHNLDYWMPYIDIVAQRRAREFGRTEFEDRQAKTLYKKHKDKMPPGFDLCTPLRGGILWMGADEAMIATQEMIEAADERGNLRSIIDAVRSHRVQDDFSSRWSYEREDFERKLYSKRSKVRVSFVQLDDTIPVHGADSEIHENLLWEDFFSLVDAKERQVVVCLRNGITRIGEIAKSLGYANHSTISRRLDGIRRKAKSLLNMT